MASKIQKIREILASGGRLNHEGASYLLWYTDSLELENKLLNHQINLGTIGIAGNFTYWISVTIYQRDLVDTGKAPREQYDQMISEGVEKLKGLLAAHKRTF